VNVLVVAVGKLKEPYLRDAEAEYVKRLRPYCRLEIREVRDEAKLLEAVPDGAVLVALDEAGQTPTSREFATRFLRGDGTATVVFAIGGADGHSPAVRERAAHVVSFGKMTIAHRLVRVLLAEQIYRGFRILRGEPYHRD
jgi:23S rRNA (pseudouridine1915-N3)-methyltransferase